jgi:hypothetical protein
MIAELQRKHRALVGELVSADEHVKVIREQITAIETVRRVMGYNGDLPTYPVRRATFPIFGRGEVSREVLQLKRDLPHLSKPRDVAREIMRRKDWDCENVALWGRVIAAVKDCNKRKKLISRPANSLSNS